MRPFKTHSLTMVAALFLGLLTSAPASPGQQSVPQQAATIHILLLNGNDGKPLQIGNNGKAGAALSLTIFASCQDSHPCFFPGQNYMWPVDSSGRTEVPNMKNLQTLVISKPSDWFKYCQDTTGAPGSLGKDPTFAVADILRTGLIAPNSCNSRLHLQSHPGELVFFLRPLTTWEWLTKGPQM
jgi:hypothetical protein